MNPLILLLFMPAAAALFWIFLYPVFARRTSSFWLMESFSISLLFYFISDGCYAMPGIPPGWLLYARLLMLLSAPCLIPMLWHYINHLLYHDGHILRASHFLWVLASVALFIAGVVLTEISNKEVVADFLLKLYREGTHIAREYRGTSLWHYYIWTSLFFRIVIGTEFLLAAIHFIKSVIQKKISFSKQCTKNGDIIYLNPLVVMPFSKNPFISETRNLPVELPCKQRETINVVLTLPDGWQAEEMSKPVMLKYDGITARIMSNQSGNQLSVRYRLDIQSTFFSQQQYSGLRLFFEKLLGSCKNIITLKKMNH